MQHDDVGLKHLEKFSFIATYQKLKDQQNDIS